MSLTILTTVYNDTSQLAELASNILLFELDWVVIDASIEGIESNKLIVKKAGGKYYNLPNSSIYSALNFGITKIPTGYYLVIGVDDRITSRENLAKVRDFISSSTYYDFIGLDWEFNNFSIKPAGKLYTEGYHAYLGNHSGGILINVNAHKIYGRYDEEFQIAADQYFIISSIFRGAIWHHLSIVLCRVGHNGLSAKKYLKSELEFYRVKVKLFRRKWLFILFNFIFRYSRHAFNRYF
jgi:hypothetical protein